MTERSVKLIFWLGTLASLVLFLALTSAGGVRLACPGEPIREPR